MSSRTEVDGEIRASIWGVLKREVCGGGLVVVLERIVNCSIPRDMHSISTERRLRTFAEFVSPCL